MIAPAGLVSAGVFCVWGVCVWDSKSNGFVKFGGSFVELNFLRENFVYISRKGLWIGL